MNLSHEQKERLRQSPDWKIVQRNDAIKAFVFNASLELIQEGEVYGGCGQVVYPEEIMEVEDVFHICSEEELREKRAQARQDFWEGTALPSGMHVLD